MLKILFHRIKHNRSVVFLLRLWDILNYEYRWEYGKKRTLEKMYQEKNVELIDEISLRCKDPECVGREMFYIHYHHPKAGIVPFTKRLHDYTGREFCLM